MLEQLALLNQKANQAQTEAEREHALKQLDAFIAVNAEYLYKTANKSITCCIGLIRFPNPPRTKPPLPLSCLRTFLPRLSFPRTTLLLTTLLLTMLLLTTFPLFLIRRTPIFRAAVPKRIRTPATVRHQQRRHQQRRQRQQQHQFSPAT